MSNHTNSFTIKEKTFKYYDLKSLDGDKLERLPFTHKILLENALRHSEDDNEGPKDVETILNWNPKSDRSTEISFTPSRVILQDFTGVPAGSSRSSGAWPFGELRRRPCRPRRRPSRASRPA